jgi:hypothetical protein
MNDEAFDLLNRLREASWFSRVGDPLDSVVGIKAVNSWQDAFRWCAQPITRWCSVEAKNVLYQAVQQRSPSRFAEWIEVARDNLPHVEQLLRDKLGTRAGAPPLTPRATEWIQSQLVGALLECCYADVADVRLSRNQMDLYVAGHFPCGWTVGAPEEFPARAILLVY